MNQVYIINGKPRIGKDSFVKEVKKYLANVNYRVYNISAIEPILHLVEQIGFDVAKTVTNRKMFSLIKQAVDLRDYTFNVTQNTVQNILTKKVQTEIILSLSIVENQKKLINMFGLIAQKQS